MVAHPDKAGCRPSLAQANGNYGENDRAITLFDETIAFCRENGLRPELGFTLADCAETLTIRDAPGDREKAAKLRDEAISIATELGMKPLLERVLAKREITKA